MIKHIKSAAIAAALIIAALGSVASEAQARGRIGTDETLHAYAKTGLTNQNKPISLCYKASTYNFIAPVYTTDEKVLCREADKKYWPMPTGEKLKKYQAAGLMPNPIPDYTRSFWDYVFGYLLWIILAGIALFTIVSSMFKKKSDDGDEQSA